MALVLQESSNAIIAPIEIKLDKLEKLEGVVKRMRAADAGLPKGGGSTAGKGKLSFEDDTIENTLESMFGRGVGTTGAAGARNAMSLVQNPMGFIMGIVSNPIVAGAILAAASAKMILDILMLQGNVLDKHFKRVITKEDNAARRRHSRAAIRAGLGDQVIITNESGSTSPAYAINTYAARRNGDVDTMKAFQIRNGYRF